MTMLRSITFYEIQPLEKAFEDAKLVELFRLDQYEAVTHT